MKEKEEQSKKKTRVPGPIWEGTALKLFKSIEASITDALEQSSTPEHLASEVITGLSKHFGGQVFYIPKSFKYNLEQRNKELYCVWKDGASIRELSKKYGLASATTYDIVASFAKEEGLKKSKNRFIK